jgi:heavy metal translocating P-type ATPase
MAKRLPVEHAIAALSGAGIAIHLIVRYGMSGLQSPGQLLLQEAPLIVVLVLGGPPLLWGLLRDLWRREFRADLLAGLSIVTAIVLHEYLAGVLVVLMLSGGKALESYAVRSASAVLQALAKRVPSTAHRRVDGAVSDVGLESIAVGDTLIVFPHEICPVDGVVVEGHGMMDESYLTGEPYMMSKAPGSEVLSGAVNGQSALTIRAEKLPVDSRYAKIMQVMRDSEQQRPQMRRLADQLGMIYTPVAIVIAAAAWAISGEAVRFLAVLVVATPCPLIIAIPVAVIGSISLAARRGIIIKDPTVLESIRTCTVALFDKTGTLTYGRPRVAATIPVAPLSATDLLELVASLERYSRHPLAAAIVEESKRLSVAPLEAVEVSERPGEGLRGIVGGKQVAVTSRTQLLAQHPEVTGALPRIAPGMECAVLVDGSYAGVFQFRDEPREEGEPFIRHLGGHGFKRVLLVSGDRETEVRYLAEKVGIKEIHFGQTPEQKLALVRSETARADTVFLGDGINDAPALTAATVGIGFGQASDITAEAAGAVVLDSSLQRVDELLHIGSRMRSIALQSAIGGMVLSAAGMTIAAFGHLPPVAGAISQEIIDVIAVANALRAALAPESLSDY